jgi:hypothetical protein
LEHSPASYLLFYFVVRMIWWFVILGISTLVVVCVAIAVYMRLRRHLRAAHAAHDEAAELKLERHSESMEP